MDIYHSDDRGIALEREHAMMQGRPLSRRGPRQP
jgi:hypothetical protein